METVVVDYRNIDQEHICCSMSDKQCVAAKKAWLKNNFEDGVVFRKANVRGKVFIEYMPADDAWCPVDAPQYMFINCLWVAGKYQGQGYSKVLLRECIAESKIKGKIGLVALTASKKKPYLADKEYLLHLGFQVADTAEPYFELMYLPFAADAPKPKFLEQAKTGLIEETGWVMYYTHQCPFTAKYVPLAQDIATELGVDLRVIKIDVPRDKNAVADPNIIHPHAAPCPFTTYSLYHDGKFVTHEIQSEAKLRKLWQK